jgi:hypothetical protein
LLKTKNGLLALRAWLKMAHAYYQELTEPRPPVAEKAKNRSFAVAAQ